MMLCCCQKRKQLWWGGGGGGGGGGGKGGLVQIADCFVSKMEVIHSGVMLMIHYSVSTILALNYCRCTLGYSIIC